MNGQNSPSSLYIFTETTPLFRKCVKFQARQAFFVAKVLEPIVALQTGLKTVSKRFSKFRRIPLSNVVRLMPKVRTILGMRTISETTALVFGHLPVILSMRVYLHIQPTFPYPVWNPTGPLRPGSVSRVFFLLKNLKGRVSERTLRNTERYALSRYLPHSHCFPNPSDFREKKFAAVVSHKPTDMLSTIPTANVVRTIPYTNALENDE